MEINNNIAIGQSTNTVANEKTDRAKLSTEDFLKIMSAEISNPNPMGDSSGGGSSTDYLSQIAQFSILDEMTNISENLNVMTLMGQQQYAFNLIGKEVTLSDGAGEEIKGKVDKVKFEEGYGVIEVQGKDYYLGSVIEVSNPESEVDK